MSEVEKQDDNDIVYKTLGAEHPISQALMKGDQVYFHDVMVSMVSALHDRIVKLEQRMTQ